MAGRIIVTRTTGAFVGMEHLGFSLLISWLTTSTYKLNWAWGVVLFIGLLLVVAFLFYRFRLFMYVFTLCFSLIWAKFAYMMTLGLDKKSGSTSGLIMAGVVFTFSLWFHRDEFNFRRGAKVTEIER